MTRKPYSFLILLCLVGLTALIPGPAVAETVPFTAKIEIDMNPREIVEEEAFVNVPPGKRLVVEFVSVTAAVLPGQKVILTIKADNDAWVPLTFQGIFPIDRRRLAVFRASNRVLIFAGPGKQVAGEFRRSSPVGKTGEMIATISGFLEDLSAD